MESLIYQFMAYFFPLEGIPVPVLSVMGFILAFFVLYALTSFFTALFGRVFSG